MLQLPLLPLRDGQIRMPKVYHKDEAILLKKSVTAKRFKKSEGRKIVLRNFEKWHEKLLDVLVVLWQSPRLNHFLWNAWRMYPQTTACMHMWMELPTVVKYHRTNTPKLELTTFRFGAKNKATTETPSCMLCTRIQTPWARCTNNSKFRYPAPQSKISV